MQSGFPTACLRLIGTGYFPVFALMYACASREVPPASPVVPIQNAVPASTSVPVQKPEVIYRETGIAAWYGKDLHGKKTASG
jgi:rare lipoprotein A (peptidoglycan hydrolase)